MEMLTPAVREFLLGLSSIAFFRGIFCLAGAIGPILFLITGGLFAVGSLLALILGIKLLKGRRRLAGGSLLIGFLILGYLALMFLVLPVSVQCKV